MARLSAYEMRVRAPAMVAKLLLETAPLMSALKMLSSYRNTVQILASRALIRQVLYIFMNMNVLFVYSARELLSHFANCVHEV